MSFWWFKSLFRESSDSSNVFSVFYNSSATLRLNTLLLLFLDIILSRSKFGTGLESDSDSEPSVLKSWFWKREVRTKVVSVVASWKTLDAFYLKAKKIGCLILGGEFDTLTVDSFTLWAAFFSFFIIIAILLTSLMACNSAISAFCLFLSSIVHSSGYSTLLLNSSVSSSDLSISFLAIISLDRLSPTFFYLSTCL